jgi:1-acyl-sn-glycerol-3-phosphate acyltransferase
MSEPIEPAKPRHSAEMSAVLKVIRTMVGEVHPHWKNLHFTPHTQLEKELGLDSMARAELQLRIEEDLQVQLADNAGVCAATPHDLLQAVHAGRSEDPAWRPCPDAGGANDVAELLMGSFENPASPGRQPARGFTDWLYAVYVWPVFVILLLLAWVLLLLTPGERVRRKLAHVSARLLFFLTLTPLRVSGHEHLDPHKAQIIVANHASYLDGFILTAALDLPIHFIVKGELARNTPVRVMLQRFGVEFVDRFNANKGTSDVNRIAAKSRNGQSIVFFPEGTFTTFAGLQPFRMGAFVTAARAGVPVVPVSIRGAREIVRGHDWFPYRGRITVTIGPPIHPQGEGWEVALNLRDAARHEIVRHCGEPDLVDE